MITDTTIKLQKFRRRHGLTQLRACVELRIPLRTWQGWENDGREPSEHEWLFLEWAEELWAGRMPRTSIGSTRGLPTDAFEASSNGRQLPKAGAASNAKLEAWLAANPDKFGR